MEANEPNTFLLFLFITPLLIIALVMSGLIGIMIPFINWAIIKISKFDYVSRDLKAWRVRRVELGNVFSDRELIAV